MLECLKYGIQYPGYLHISIINKDRNVNSHFDEDNFPESISLKKINFNQKILSMVFCCIVEGQKHLFACIRITTKVFV